MNKEKVRELAYLLIGRDTGSVDSKCKIITEWFEQNPVEPVVVGLSDEQLQDFYTYYLFKPNHTKSLTNLEFAYKEWAKTQTFTQPNTLLEYQLDAARKEINRVESLNANLLKQQFEPDWDHAPEWANWLAQDDKSNWTWYEKEPKEGMGYFATKWKCENVFVKNHNWQQTLQQRPKTTPQVEVGQVWLCAKNKSHYLVKYIETLEGESKINNGEWVKDLVLVTYWLRETEEKPREYTRTLADFITKFEQVKS